jgi:xylulose-5-phosphate/fructose-6-phosphate phosphoketolase
MVVRNDLDRYHLAFDALDRVANLGSAAAYAEQAFRDKLIEHRRYVAEYGDDRPEIRDWQWSGPEPGHRS